MQIEREARVDPLVAAMMPRVAVVMLEQFAALLKAMADTTDDATRRAELLKEYEDVEFVCQALVLHLARLTLLAGATGRSNIRH